MRTDFNIKEMLQPIKVADWEPAKSLTGRRTKPAQPISLTSALYYHSTMFSVYILNAHQQLPLPKFCMHDLSPTPKKEFSNYLTAVTFFVWKQIQLQECCVPNKIIYTEQVQKSSNSKSYIPQSERAESVEICWLVYWHLWGAAEILLLGKHQHSFFILLDRFSVPLFTE